MVSNLRLDASRAKCLAKEKKKTQFSFERSKKTRISQTELL